MTTRVTPGAPPAYFPSTALRSGRSGDEPPFDPYLGYTEDDGGGAALAAARVNQEALLRRLKEGARDLSFSDRLHLGISEAHKIARTNPFLLSLIEGEMKFCSKAYVKYLCNLYVIHRALEEAQEAILEKYGKERAQEFVVLTDLFRTKKLLGDIRIWSIFNGLSGVFADLSEKDPLFIRNVELFVDSISLKFAADLEQIGKEDPLIALGSMYALYGTIMSGGQRVKEGVKKGFVCRIQDKDEREEQSEYLHKILSEIHAHPEKLDEYAERSVSTFSLPQQASLATIKKEWHDAFNSLLTKLKLEPRAEEELVEKIIAQANYTIRAFLAFIDSMLENLKKE